MKVPLVLALALLAGSHHAQMFAQPQVFPATNVATARAIVADFTGDGIPDIAIDATDAMTSAIDVYPTDGNGGVLAPIRSAFVNPAYAPAQEPTWLIGAADFNQDGRLDLLTTSACMAVTGTLRVHLNLGAGVLAPQQPPPGSVGAGIGFVAIADFDGNGTSEIAISNVVVGTLVYSVSGTPSILTLLAHVPVPSALITAGDFDGDGLKDLAITAAGLGPGSGDVTVFHHVPGGGIASAGPFPTGYQMATFACSPFNNTFMLAHDVDGDGDDDLIMQHAFEATRVLPGDPAAVLLPVQGGLPTGLSSGGDPEPILGDFDSDGIAEIVLTFLMRRIPPSFSTPSEQNLPYLIGPSGFTVPAVAAADLDGDGDRDLVYAGENIIATALGETIRTPPCAGSVSPSFAIGSATPGNAMYALRLTGLQPGASAVLGISTAPGASSAGPCTIAIGLAPGQLLVPSGPLGLATADATGQATVAIPLPNDPSLLGTEYYAQWLAVDPNGPWSFGGVNYLLSESKKIVIW